MDSTKTKFVHKNTHYDGGWEAEGIENILGGGGYAVFASDFDDPGATLNATYEGITFVDARSPLWGMCFYTYATAPLPRFREGPGRASSDVLSDDRAVGGFLLRPITSKA